MQSLEELKDWAEYRAFMRKYLKLLSTDEESFYVSKARVDFDLDGAAWKGYGILLGKKSRMLAQKMRQSGALFLQGTCQADGKTLVIRGLPEKLIVGATRTLRKLKLGFEIRGEASDAGASAAASGAAKGTSKESESADGRGGSGDSGGSGGSGDGEGTSDSAVRDETAADAEQKARWARLKAKNLPRLKQALSAGGPDVAELKARARELMEATKSGDYDAAIRRLEEILPLLDGGAPAGDLPQRAQRIEKAVVFWAKTEKLALSELRKLQRAILATKNLNAKPLVRALERIMTRLGKIDDEAREAAEAAARGDAQGFESARRDFLTKAESILDYVENDALIRDADENPMVAIKIRETLATNLGRLMKAV